MFPSKCFRVCYRAASTTSALCARRREVVLDGVVRQTRPLVPGLRCYASEVPDSDTPSGSQQQQDSTRAGTGPTGKSASDDLYFGISASTFPEEVNKILMSPLKPQDVEIKPDGLVYLPEIKYRRILNQAFGPGGWALMPRGEAQHFKNETEGAQLITREFALFCLGRYVAQALGEHTFYTKLNLSYGKAVESAKSNGLMRCCKDLGIASELWDPSFVAEWRNLYANEIWCENVRTKDKKKLWRKKNSKEIFPYPWKIIK